MAGAGRAIRATDTSLALLFFANDISHGSAYDEKKDTEDDPINKFHIKHQPLQPLCGLRVRRPRA